MGQGGPAAVRGQGRDLVVDQDQAAFGGEEDVVGVQIAEDHAPPVQGLDRPPDLGQHVEHPRGVLGDALLVAGRPGQGVPLDEEPLQRIAVDELLDQEMVVAEREVVDQGRHRVQPGQALQHVPLVRQPCHGVAVGGVEPGMRARLLQHDPLAGAQAPPEIHASAVGELDDALDRVRQVVGGHRVAGGQMGLQKSG